MKIYDAFIMYCLSSFTGRAECCLGDFLKEIKAERVRDVRFQDMANIIVLHALDESKSSNHLLKALVI